MTGVAGKAKPPVQLEADVMAAATALSLSLADVVKSDGKAYEAWMLFALVKRLRDLYVRVEPHDHQGNKRPAVFRLKGGPGHIVSVNAPGDQPCHFIVGDKNKRYLELHVSIEHVGASGEVHEVDIALIHGLYADAIRHLPTGGPYPGPRYLCLELKNYAQTNTLDKNFARAFTAVHLELKDGRIECSNGDVLTVQTNPPAFSLVTSAKMVGSTVRMLEHYGIRAFSRVYPGTAVADAFLDEIAEYIERLVR